ncbi:MAG: enoyl-CoA hydratase-related protein [Spirochaetales bacterium]|nr:enoyl-CoA hydratase-related protein [Spirochaetales bacterium]
MEYKNIIYTLENGIAKIEINRPKAFNALNTETNNEIEDVVDAITDSPDVRVLIITGSSKVFVAGADVTELAEANPRDAYNNCCLAHRIFKKLEALQVPVIAAICGPTLGGGLEMALSCDFRIAGESGLFGLPEITLGIIPGAGGTQRLAKLIGASRAKELVMLGNRIDAATAKEYGLVNVLCKDEEVAEEAQKMAEKLCKRPAIALKFAKECVNFGANMNLDTGLEFEKSRFSLAFNTADQKEGMKAFFEKRKPNFTHK